MDGSYWSKVLTRRVTRRRAVAVSAGSAAAAAFLAACGSSSNNNSSSTGSSGATASGATGATGSTGASGATGAKSALLADIVDSTSKAVKGGTFLWPNAKEPGHFDGQSQGQVQLNHENGLVYEALVRNKPGIGKPSSWSEVEKGLADSWEVSPDKLTITFKIHPGIKWQNVAPVSGRAFDATDVAASWDRYVSLPGNNKGANANSVNPAAPGG